jgi:hypothetical protein
MPVREAPTMLQYHLGDLYHLQQLGTITQQLFLAMLRNHRIRHGQLVVMAGTSGLGPSVYSWGELIGMFSTD